MNKDVCENVTTLMKKAIYLKKNKEAFMGRFGGFERERDVIILWLKKIKEKITLAISKMDATRENELSQHQKDK